MVFESVLQPQLAERKPLDSFVLSFVMSTVSIMLALIVFTPFLQVNVILGVYALFFIGFMVFTSQQNYDRKSLLLMLAAFIFVTAFFLSLISSKTMGINYAPYGSSVSLAMIFFTALGLAPFMVRILYVEERKDITDLHESFLVRHKEVLLVYACLFLGAVLAYSLWFTLLPQPIVNSVFTEQIATLNWVSGVRSGLFFGVSSTQSLGFKIIVLNNFKVLAVATLLSFALGSGAIFILTWNASIIAVAVGASARNLISYYAGLGSLAGVAAYFHALPLSLSQLIFHGSLEIVAYFIGGLAGGILSVAITHHQGKATQLVIKDSAMLLGVAAGLIILAGAVEVLIMGI